MLVVLGKHRHVTCPEPQARRPLPRLGEPDRLAQLRVAERVREQSHPAAALDSLQLRQVSRPACIPAAIGAVLAANADADVLRRYDADLDAAFEQARSGGDLTPLLDTVRRWWFEADAWRDPAARDRFQARVSRYLSDGPPPADQRVSRAQVRERHGV